MGTRLPGRHNARNCLNARTWKISAPKNITGVVMMNNAHSVREACPDQSGCSNHILVLLVLGSRLMYTIPITNVGMATQKVKSSRSKMCRCSRCCIARERSSTLGGRSIAAEYVSWLELMMDMKRRAVRSGDWGV